VKVTDSEVVEVKEKQAKRQTRRRKQMCRVSRIFLEGVVNIKFTHMIRRI